MNEKQLKIEGKLELLANMKRRLSTVEQEDCLCPLAGQEYRNQIIKLLDFIKGEVIKEKSDE
jgi:hypothetical protein